MYFNSKYTAYIYIYINTGSSVTIFCAASLGVASHITVTIAASDDAHGVFQFSADSVSVSGTEPEDGRSSVVLQVCTWCRELLEMRACVRGKARCTKIG